MITDDAPTRHGTHDVLNQPPPLSDYNLFTSDTVLSTAIGDGEAAWSAERATAFGAKLGSAAFIEHGFLANRYTPELQTHDRFGHRIDEVRFHPSWHALMAAGVEAQVHSLPWTEQRPGTHVARAALHYMLSQIEAGVGCPLTMTFAVVPSLRMQPEIAGEWVPRVTSRTYDSRPIPASEKQGALMGMAMTEKQGGSDVRANTTQAHPIHGGGPGAEYELTGHKWFCSAPMCDAFLTLAQTDGGLSCFLVPRWLPDGTRNRFFIQRLKDKLGNRSNASSEIEYNGTWARMVGEEGRGVRTIIEMVGHTRLDCIIGSAGLMRQALVQALHHARHRAAFGKTLIEQPLMRSVLADLALESEAAATLMLRIARSYDEMANGPHARAFSRIATAISKYWVCKRAPRMIYECMECHGGNGYVEDSVLPRLYREAPVNSIWEGSGNVICLDVLRAMEREPECVEALLAELEAARGRDARYDGYLDTTKAALLDRAGLESRARYAVERLAKSLQAAVLLQEGPQSVAEAYCAARLGESGEYGAAVAGMDGGALIERAVPQS